MADDDKGVKSGSDTPDPNAVTPTATDTGDRVGAPTDTPAGTPPADDSLDFIDESQAVEHDGKKLVPLEALEAERKKRQELDKRLKEAETKPAPTDDGAAEPPESEWDWDAIKSFGTQPATETRPDEPTTTPSPDWLSRVNEHIEDLRGQGRHVEAFLELQGLWEHQKQTMRDGARKVISGYDDLPTHKITNDELVYFQQNPEALRGVLAKAKFSGKSTSTPPTPGTSAPAPTNSWEQTKEQLLAEGRKQALEELRRGAGMTGEGTAGGIPPAGGPEFELDESAKAFYRKLGYSDEEMAGMAEKLNEENIRVRGY